MYISRIHRYSDIQVLMMFTETETLASTLHHNKFIYLDYAFQLPSYIYIYRERERERYGKRKIVIQINNVIYIYSKVVKLAILAEGNQKAPFSIATTLRCRVKALLFFLDCSTLPLIRTLYYRVLSKDVSSTILNVFGMTSPGIEPMFPGPLANTLPIRNLRYVIYYDNGFWKYK